MNSYMLDVFIYLLEKWSLGLFPVAPITNIH